MELIFVVGTYMLAAMAWRSVDGGTTKRNGGVDDALAGVALAGFAKCGQRPQRSVQGRV